VLLIVAACDDDVNSLLDGTKNPTGQESSLPAALQCNEKPAARSYVFFDGTKLEDSRANESAAANRARFKAYDVLAGEYQRLLGVVPTGYAAAASSFDAPSDRWFVEPSHSGVSLNAAFDLSFEACVTANAQAAAGKPAPTEESAARYCTTLMRRAWSQSPSPDEIAGCVELATKKLAEEPDPSRRWSFVCASILSSSHFLTY
jgi:hypothetical protein